MFVQRGKDVHVPAADLWLDPSRSRRFAFVSHAHGDHIGRHEHVVATPATARLMESRLGVQRVTRLEFGETLTLPGGVELRVHPAGHVLGSAQLEVRHRGERMVYTGDFRLRPSATCEDGVVVPCDVLLMETTYGRPVYRFPPRETVVPALADDLRAVLERGSTPVLLAYALGRAQELLALLAPFALPLRISPAIDAMCRVYRELGVALPEVELARVGQTDGCVVLVPPGARRSRLVRKATNVERIAVTGWGIEGAAAVPYDADRAHVLSDHADFDELNEYVDRSGARVVYTTHGAGEFHRHLRERGVSAHPAQVRCVASG